MYGWEKEKEKMTEGLIEGGGNSEISAQKTWDSVKV